MNVPQGMAYRARRLAGSHRFHLLCIYIVVFLIHFSVQSQVKWIVHASDALPVVGTAAYFSGLYDWSYEIQYHGYYGYVQALFYAPVFYMTSNPELRYILMGTINSFALSFIPLMAYDILCSFKFLTHEKRCFYAFLVGIFPSAFIYTKWLWNETAMCVLPWIVGMLLTRLADNRGNRILQSALLGFVSILCYASHGRGILFPFLAIVMIMYCLLFHRKAIVNLPVFVTVFLLSYRADKFMKAFVTRHVWLRGAGARLNNTMPPLRRIDVFIHPLSIRNISGHLMSAIFSSYGLLIVVLLFTFRVIYAKIKKRPLPLDRIKITVSMEVFWLYSLFSLSGAIAILMVMWSTAREKEYLIYTRYWSNTLGFVALCALIVLYELKWTRRWTIASIVMYLIWIPMYFVIRPYVGFRRPNIFLNLVPYMPSKNLRGLFICGWIVWAIFLVILLATQSRIKWVKIISALFTAFVFLEAFYYDSARVILPLSEWYGDCIKDAAKELEVFEKLEKDLNEEIVLYYYNPTKTKDYASAAMQLMLPDLKIRGSEFSRPSNYRISRFESFANESSLIYSGGDYHLDYKDKNYYRIIETRAIEGLRVIDENFAWIYGEELKNRYVETTGKPAENHYGETKTTNLPLSMFFTTKAGVKDENNYITSTGTSGTLLYGPYIYLEKGRYQITIRGELLSGELDRSSSFDIRSNITKITHLTLPDLSQFVHGNSLEINVPLTTNVDITAGEFCISVNSGVKLKITSVNLRYFGSLMPGDPGFIYDFGEPDSFDYFGFSEQEDSFRRIDAKLAAVSLGWLPGKQDCVCRVELAEPLPEEWFADSQYALSVSVNDRPEIPLTLRPGDTSVSFPLRRIDLEENNILTFRSDLRPLGTGDSDTEKYGIPIQKIVVKSEEE